MAPEQDNELSRLYGNRFDQNADYPLARVKLYLALPFLWRLFGRQFLMVAQKG